MKKISKSVYSKKTRNEVAQVLLRDGGGSSSSTRIRPRSNSFSLPSTRPSFNDDDGETNTTVCVFPKEHSQDVIVKQTPLKSIRRKLTSKFSKIRQRNQQETSIGEGQLPGSSGKKQHASTKYEKDSRFENEYSINSTHGKESIDRQILGYRLSKSEEALDYCVVSDEVKLPENCYVYKDENCTTPADARQAPPVPPRAPKPRVEGVLYNDNDDNQEPPRPPARPKNRAMGPLPPHLERSFRSISVNGVSDNRATVYENPGDKVRNSKCSLGIGAELLKLPRQPWYWGPLRQHEAEEKLKNMPDGMFLVRDSSDDRYLLSLSFNSNGRTLHTRIEYRSGLFSLNDSEGYPSIITLIENAVRESKDGVFGYMRDFNGVQSFPAKLTCWVSRFKEVRSLQYLCRFVIRERYARHVIPKLPIPSTIKHYVLENQY
ncbi:suppressor of cytokine signaling 7-like [Anneissia japonica]|uniref:suppressor of cytokine signaling 7-like n=1 Tax=Anneissia japonica TaxID=1529436 RepID=UPI0014257315|nr:suppressor of cytokine signaling 7-like [Anneissia japonica]